MITPQIKEVVPAPPSVNSGKLLDVARRREIDVVVMWRLNRWGRPLADLAVSLQELSVWVWDSCHSLKR
jgi:hypothetical protein